MFFHTALQFSEYYFIKNYCKDTAQELVCIYTHTLILYIHFYPHTVLYTLSYIYTHHPYNNATNSMCNPNHLLTNDSVGLI